MEDFSHLKNPPDPAQRDAALLATYGAIYLQPGQRARRQARRGDLYSYECFHGEHEVVVEPGDCAFVLGSRGGLDPANKEIPVVAAVHRGPATFTSPWFAVVIRGYSPDARSRELTTHTSLPYVNGCSTKQIFPPERAGDPTWQYLDIPPHSREQAHHIHSTARVVYILSGRGLSHVGMEGANVTTELTAGMTMVIDPMCPHHFETPQGEHLICLPVHIWSSTGGREFDHPMFNGTHMMNQGA